MYILIAFFICILALVYITLWLSKEKSENFVNQIPIHKVITNNKEIFDEFYSEIYDHLFPSQIRVPFEVKDIETNAIIPYKNSSKVPIKILDIGSGIGSHLDILSRHKYDVYGLDSSYHMIERSKKLYKLPSSRLKYGNAYQYQLYPLNSFTHILCLYFTIYYMDNIDTFLKNIKRWLPNDGYFVVHLVDRKMFDPILDKASPFPGFSKQKYVKKRDMRSKLEFNNFSYESIFNLNEKENKATFTELITNTKKKYKRKNVHNLNMPSLKDMEKKIKSYKFTFVHRTHLLSCDYEYQYLYYFKNIK